MSHFNECCECLKMASTVSTIATGVDTILAPASQAETINDRLMQFVKFLFNPEEKTFLGRTPRAWSEYNLPGSSRLPA